jgi:hypothetical protein
MVGILDASLYEDTDYPVNILRNMALSRVTTSHVMYADVDFWESTDLHAILHLPTTRQALAMDPKLALVVPAFQLNRQCWEWRECPEENIPRMPHNLNELAKTIKEKRGAPFDPTNRGGHGSTLYMEWIKQEPGNRLNLPCIRSNRYEPYLAFRYCRELPPFQPLFSGYGKNKMTMVMHMRRSGYQFSQLGGAFVVHYPHLDSTSRMTWNEGPEEMEAHKDAKGRIWRKRPADVHSASWTKFKRGQIDALFVEFREWLHNEIPDEARVPMCKDIGKSGEDDDARLWIDRPEKEKSTQKAIE